MRAAVIDKPKIFAECKKYDKNIFLYETLI